MWIAKFKVKHVNCQLSPRCIKHNITDFVTLLSSWKKDGRFYYTELHTLQGTDADVNRFIIDLKKDVKRLERQGNNIFTLNEEPIEKQYYSPVFDPQIILVKPILVSPKGYEHWEMACWEKEPLMRVLKVPVFKVTIESLQKSRSADLFFPRMLPKIPAKQREAIELAVDNGYYDTPRNIYLDTLAKMSNVSRQTYQENLRKAEKRLIPFLTENLLQ